MLELRAGNTICHLVDRFLDRATPPNYDEDFRIKEQSGVVITLNANVSDYTDDRDYQASRQVIFIFSGNTSVFMAVAPEDGRYYSWKDVPLESWKNTSNHDSCWRSDGTDSQLSQIFFAMCDEINAQRADDGLETKAPAYMHQFNNLGHQFVNYVRIKTRSDETSGNPGYFRKLVGIQDVER